MSGKIHHLGLLSRNLDSLGETAKYLDSVLNHIKSGANINPEQDYTLGFLFSSRGSFPFLRAMNVVSQDLDPKLKLKMIPHIFSLENLIEIISNYDRLQYKQYQPVMAHLYDNIARSMSNKIKRVAKNHEDFVLSDWDEVCSGSNIVERIKIYNRLNIPKKMPFNIISFISERRKKLDMRNVKSFKRSFHKSPESFSTYDVLMENPISWSDDEDLYKNLGFEYPGIAVPNFTYISNFIRNKAFPQFYQDFFSIFGRALSNQNENLDYKLITPIVDFQCEHLLSEINILESSYKAFMSALDLTGKRGGLKDTSLGTGDFEFDYTNGVVLMKKSGRILLDRNVPNQSKIDVKFAKYRSPFTLVYNPLVDESNILNNLLSFFKNEISDAFKIKKGKEGFRPSSNIFYVNTK